MRVVVQRVLEAKVTVDGEISGNISRGLLVLLGIHKNDTPNQSLWFVNKILNLRIFADENEKMNLNIKDVKGEILVISQFTLYGNCLSGRRPDFIEAAPGIIAEPIYNKFVSEIKCELGNVQTGVFGAHMQVASINDGPVTLIIDGQP